MYRLENEYILHKKHNQNHSSILMQLLKTRTVISSGHILEVVLRFPRKTAERDTIYQISINLFQ